MNCSSIIVVFTHAYNAEHTIRRTIDSVIAQSYGNWVYYCVDNGSTDNTGNIIGEYAVNDKRIIKLHNKQNHVWETGNTIWDVIKNHDENAFLCWLDADDEYKPMAFEHMLRFANENSLDIVACGSDFIDAKTNRLGGARKLEQALILTERNHFSDYFTVYHQYIRTVWGKLTKLGNMQNFDLNRLTGKSMIYGGDTFLTLGMFSTANRIGIIGESLHKYYLSPKSTSYKFDPGRIESDCFLHEATINFLVEKCGEISPRNEEFLYIVYFNAIKDTLNVVLNAQMMSLEKMKSINQIFTCQYTQELIHHNYPSISSALNELRSAVYKWLLAQKECRREEGADLSAEILIAMYAHLPKLINKDGLKYIISKMPEMTEYLLRKDYNRILERLQTWFKRHDADIPALTGLEIDAYKALNKPDDEIFTLYTSIRKGRLQSSISLDIDMRICMLMEKYSLLKNMNADLASAFPYAIRWVIKENFKQALDSFISVQNIEVSDNDAEAYIQFAQNLSAAAENTDAYIYFKKVWISYLVDHLQMEDARRELEEFELLLPSDGDLLELRKRLDG